mmetsp:Transcript_18432/g.58504  ORF Transcript_18432/g.58504 Transcript_18432/m.58504 type:complete len:279 (+) Transcript_18432:590-1426(+)
MRAEVRLQLRAGQQPRERGPGELRPAARADLGPPREELAGLPQEGQPAELGGAAAVHQLQARPVLEARGRVRLLQRRSEEAVTRRTLRQEALQPSPEGPVVLLEEAAERRPGLARPDGPVPGAREEVPVLVQPERVRDCRMALEEGQPPGGFEVGARVPQRGRGVGKVADPREVAPQLHAEEEHEAPPPRAPGLQEGVAQCLRGVAGSVAQCGLVQPQRPRQRGGARPPRSRIAAQGPPPEEGMQHLPDAQSPSRAPDRLRRHDQQAFESCTPCNNQL